LVVNADVTVAFTICIREYDIDEKNNYFYFSIPKEEIKISSDIQFYDVEQSKLNPFHW
jgi:hypothetical protein